MLTLQGVAYSQPNRNVVFENLHLTIHQYDKIALIGNKVLEIHAAQHSGWEPGLFVRACKNKCQTLVCASAV